MSEEKTESSEKVKVYSTPSCPWCVKAKEYLKEKNVEYEDIDVAEDEKARNAMIEKSGQMSVPVLDVHGTIIVGFDQDAIDKALGGDGSSELKQAA
ncbi:MAG: glutaredoxin family protein [Nanoarchaeota archaeon]|nr:glutaredoxin family protein [Nanoarchaeota archaeon]